MILLSLSCCRHLSGNNVLTEKNLVYVYICISCVSVRTYVYLHAIQICALPKLSYDQSDEYTNELENCTDSYALLESLIRRSRVLCTSSQTILEESKEVLEMNAAKFSAEYQQQQQQQQQQGSKDAAP